MAMTNASDLTDSLGTFHRREQFVEAFEEAWQRGQQPRLEEFLLSEGPERLPLLLDLVRVDLECRKKAGHSVRVEDYLQRFAELQGDPLLVLDLLAMERQLQPGDGGSSRQAPRQEVNEIVRRFEKSWREGRRPAIEEFLSLRAEERGTALIELVQLELELRLRAGEPARVEDYLGRFPDLASDSRQVLDLIVTEYALRRQREPGLTPKEYQDRFPGEQLRLLPFRATETLTPRPGKAPETEKPDVFPAAWVSQTRSTTLAGPESVPAACGGPPSSWPSIPGYEILGELGKGGMGVVYKARHIKLNRLVALKMVREGNQDSMEHRVRFLAEAEAVAQLSHPNIVQVHEVGQHGRVPYIALEYVDGGSLDKKLRGTPLPAQTAATLVETLARAMQAAHQRGIIHRDLKPGNVLLVATDHWPRTNDHLPLARGVEISDSSLATGHLPRTTFSPKITDFGLAKRVEGGHGLTQSGAVMGTPSYMAPEQAAGKSKEIGPKVDVYALGAILYELLAGRPPFKAATLLDTMLLVKSEEPVPPSRLNPKLPRDLETICLKCLQKEPGKRYATAEDLAEDLRRFQTGEPILARPASLWERTSKWSRRKPAAAALLAVSAAALLILILGSIGFAVYQHQQYQTQKKLQEEADAQRREAREQEKIARDHFQIAHRTVQRLTQIGYQRLRTLPHTEKIRQYFLEQSLNAYKPFLQGENPDPQAQRETGRAHLRVAEIKDMLGDRGGAQEHYLAAQKHLSSLQDRLADPALQSELALAIHGLGTIHQGKKELKKAEIALTQALKLREALAAKHPQADFQQQLAGSYYQRAILRHTQKRLTEAFSDYSAAVGMLEKLARLPNPPEDSLPDLARVQASLAVLLDQKGNFKEAQELFHRSMQQWAKAVTRYPGFPDYQLEHGRTQLNLGVLLHGRGDPFLAEAETHYKKAREIFSDLAGKFPHIIDCRHLWAVSQSNLGTIHGARKHYLAAIEAWKETVALYQKLAQDVRDNAGYPRELGRAYNELAIALLSAKNLSAGEKALRAGLVILEKQVGEHPTDAELWQFLIGNYANLSQVLSLDRPKEALEVKHKEVTAHLALAEILLAENDHATARAKLAGVQQKAPPGWKGFSKAARLTGQGMALAAKDSNIPEAQKKALLHSYGMQALAFLDRAVKQGELKDRAFLDAPEFTTLRDWPEFKKIRNGVK